MKKSHKREILMARVIFAMFCLIVVLIIALIVMAISSGVKKSQAKKAASETSESSSTSSENSEYTPLVDATEPDSETETTTEPAETVETTVYRWTTDSVRFRSEASTDSSDTIIDTLAEGTKVEWIADVDSEWTEVMYNDQIGYISSAYLTDTDPDGDTDTGEDDSGGTSEAAAITEYTAASLVTVVIDPGHQTTADSTREANGPGSSTMKARVTGGTTGVASGVPEYQLNLDISLLLKKELESRGYTVYLTRSSNDVNISNKERAEYATEVGGDIFVRIHANGSEDAGVNGALTISPSSENPYVAYLADSSMALSECILNAYCSATGLKNLGTTTSDTMSGINWSTIPVVFLEMGYMTNEEEDLKMQDSAFRTKMVLGIADGIDDYFGF